MIGNKTKVDDLEARRIILETADAAAKAARKAARLLAKRQQELIDSRQRPSGGSQKDNDPAYAKRKKGKPPLWKTGRLRDPKTWRTSTRKGDGKVILRPPKDREMPIAVNRTRGYFTVFDELPADFEDETQALIDAEMKKVRT